MFLSPNYNSLYMYDLHFQNDKLKEIECKHKELFPNYRLSYQLIRILEDLDFRIFNFDLLNCFVKFLSFMLHQFLNNLSRRHYMKKVFLL